jgi:hypothetical protein
MTEHLAWLSRVQGQADSCNELRNLGRNAAAVLNTEPAELIPTLFGPLRGRELQIRMFEKARLSEQQPT